jgi:hypothetical protein
MDHLDVWQIESKRHNCDLTQYINNNIDVLAKTHLLDLNKTKYTLIEKYVYDTAMFHFKRLNINNTDGYFVEFWCKNKARDSSKLHVDCDESLKKKYIYKYPLLSSVTYLNKNTETPTIITGIDLDSYKYKKFEQQTEILLSLPMTNKQITFDGHFYHGNVVLTNDYDDEKGRYIIAINLWNTLPNDVLYYQLDNDSNNLLERDISLISITACNNICNINVSDDILNYNFFNDILYNKKKDTCYQLNRFIESKKNENNHTFKILLDKTIKQDELNAKLKNEYGNIIDDYDEIMRETNAIKYNRFLQRFTYTKIYSPDMCRYIIKESEKHAANNNGWTKTRHINYPTTDLPVDAMPSVLGIVSETFITIMDKIVKSYNLSQNITLNIRDLFVVKYAHDAQNSLEMHKDGSVLSFSILLNDANEFEGGGTYFDDGLTAYLNQGDMIIHSGKIKHSGLPITKGLRYLLVGFIDIQFACK